ncbi:MAG: DUF3857 domain-containing protein [Bacteroidetes bacterium]|nr:DUF3857 domain-containing protein [Bacteroidota bacterium]
MKRVYIIAFLFILVMSDRGFTQNSPEDATYRLLVKEYTLNADGSSDFRLYKEVLLNTHRAFHRDQGETFIVYNPEYQALKINDSYTVMADGKKVVTPANAFNEVLPRFAAQVPDYNHLREMVVTHTGLEIGAVIYLDYSIHTKKGFMPAFMGDESLIGEAPVNEMRLIVHIPADKQLMQKTFNIRTAPEEATANGMKTYTWVFRNLPAEKWDSHQDHSMDPRVIFSTEDLKRAYFSIVKQDAFTFMTPPELAAIAAEIAKAEGDNLKTIMKLQAIVSKDLNTWNVPGIYNGFQCRTPQEVWKSNGGTPMEKSVLLASLLMNAGINARPLMVFPSKFYDPSVACLSLAESFLVQINPRETEQWILSATGTGDRNLRYDLPGQTLLLLDGSAESLRTFEYPLETAIVNLGAGLVIQDTARMTGTMTLELTRQFNPYYRLKNDAGQAAGLISGVSKSNIKNSEVKKLSESKSLTTYELECDKPFRGYAGYFYLNLPESREGFESWNIRFLSAYRDGTYVLPDLLDQTNEYSIVFPESIELLSPLQNSELDYSFGKLTITMKLKGNELLIKKQLLIRERIIRQADYQDLRNMVNVWINPGLRELVFRSRTY